MDDVSAVAAVVQRPDVDRADGPWWMSIIDACGFQLAHHGDLADGSALEWSKTLVLVLNAAWRAGSIDKFDLLSRRLRVQVDGWSIGCRDFGGADSICDGLLAALDDLGEDAVAAGRDVQYYAAERDLPKPRIYALVRLRGIFKMIEPLAAHLESASVRAAVNAWDTALKVGPCAGDEAGGHVRMPRPR
jgi:hypothetical protein